MSHLGLWIAVALTLAGADGPAACPPAVGRLAPGPRAGRLRARDRHAHGAGGRRARPGVRHREPHPLPAQGLQGPAGGPDPALRRHRRRRPGRPRSARSSEGTTADHEPGVRPRRLALRRDPRRRSIAWKTATATAGPTARPPRKSPRRSSGSTRRATTRTTASRASPSTLSGNVYFGLGENLGADYRLIGSDGTTLAGGGEGGNIYRCRPDGSKLERVATGFWNPFHVGVRRLRPALRRRQRPRLAAPVPAAPHRRRGRLRLPLPQRPQGAAPVHGLERRAARHPAHGRRHRRGAERAGRLRVGQPARGLPRQPARDLVGRPPDRAVPPRSRAGPRSGRRWSRWSPAARTSARSASPRPPTARSTSATGSTSRTTCTARGASGGSGESHGRPRHVRRSPRRTSPTPTGWSASGPPASWSSEATDGREALGERCRVEPRHAGPRPALCRSSSASGRRDPTVALKAAADRRPKSARWPSGSACDDRLPVATCRMASDPSPLVRAEALRRLCRPVGQGRRSSRRLSRTIRSSSRPRARACAGRCVSAESDQARR